MKNTKRKRQRMQSMSQTKALLDHLRKSCYKAYLQACVAVYSGMRLDEICRMKPMDIDGDAGILTIDKVKSATKEFKTRYIFFKDDPMLEDTLRQIDDRYNEGEGNVYFPVTFKVIGKQGRNAQALRTILSATAGKTRKRYILEILE